MPFTIKETKGYEQPVSKVQSAIIAAIEGLEGTLVSQEDTQLVAHFNKTIHGKVLGEKTYLKVEIKTLSENTTELSIEAYPLDAIGRKLMFGARKGVTRTVLDWFYAHIENRLK
jgi:hypothetical protein